VTTSAHGLGEISRKLDHATSLALLIITSSVRRVVPVQSGGLSATLKAMRALVCLDAAICAALLVGCGDDGGGGIAVDALQADAAHDAPIDSIVTGGGVFPVEGDVVGPAPASGIVVVAWVVSSGSPDYVYKFGQGASTETHYMVSFTGDPPAAALNSYGVGVGILAILAPGTTLPPDGIVSESAFNGAKFSTDYGIIFKAPNATSPAAWMQSFPQGFACGHCVRAATGFDSFEVTQCGNVQILTNPLGVCNWT
jgi:hypothetical protein